MSLFIAAIFDWEPRTDQDDALLEEVVSNGRENIPAVGLKLTLTKRRMPWYGNMPTDGWQLHDKNLTQDAFNPKIYTLKFEQGTFPVIANITSGLCHWYSLHLKFDPSPYPPLDEWAMKRPAEGHKYWERKDFYREQIEGDVYYDPESEVSRRDEMEGLKAELARKRGLQEDGLISDFRR